MGVARIEASIFAISEDANETMLTCRTDSSFCGYSSDLIIHSLMRYEHNIVWRPLRFEARFRANYRAYISRCRTPVAHLLKESVFNNKRHYILLRCISWYKQRAWRTAARWLLYYGARTRSPFVVRCRKSFRIPWNRSYPRRWRRRRKGVWKSVRDVSRVMKVREGKERARMPAWRYRIDRTCNFLDYSRRESRSTVVASRLSPGGNGRSISLSCVNVLFPLLPSHFLSSFRKPFPFVMQVNVRPYARKRKYDSAQWTTRYSRIFVTLSVSIYSEANGKFKRHVSI